MPGITKALPRERRARTGTHGSRRVARRRFAAAPTRRAGKKTSHRHANGLAFFPARHVRVIGRATFDAIWPEMGQIDILVNNAGIAHVGTIEQTSPEDLDRLYAVNVRGVYLCSRAAIAVMLRQGRGVILNMASIASLVGVPDRFAYSMTKGAVLTMTMSIAIDYVKRGIRCNCICPARVDTPFVEGYLREHYPGREAEMRRTLEQYQPIGRMCKPEEVASLALYLCSDEAAFVTGQAYPIDGGVLVA